VSNTSVLLGVHGLVVRPLGMDRRLLVRFAGMVLMATAALAIADPKNLEIGNTPAGKEIKRATDAASACNEKVFKGPDYASCIMGIQQANSKKGGDTSAFDLGLYFNTWLTMDIMARPDEPADSDFLKQAGVLAKPEAAKFFKLYRDLQKKVPVTDEQMTTLQDMKISYVKARVLASARETGS